MKKLSRFYNRDLSWLAFNYRILMEAGDPSVPLYERIKFMAIYSSNLDEFFRVRVASWRRIQRIKKKITSGMQVKPKRLLKDIYREVDRQLQEYGQVWNQQIFPALGKQGINLYQRTSPLSVHRHGIRHYFLSRVLSYLQPVIFSDGSHETPFLENGALYFALKLQRGKGEKEKIYYAHLNIPSGELPRFLRLPDYRRKHYIIWLDDIIRMNLHYVFPGFKILGCYAIKLNRDADLDIEDEYTGDLVEKIQKQVEKRQIGIPARFLYDEKTPHDLRDFLMQRYQLAEEDMVRGGRYHNLNDLMKLPNPLHPKLTGRPMPALYKSTLDQPSIMKAIASMDQILHFPYQSYDYVLRFFNEAAIDPYVKNIKVTLYRVAHDSVIVNALISAARNGKQVTAFVEVKARFDEVNNLNWAKKMEEAGVKLIYSMPGLKVHAKVALVVRKKGVNTRSYAYFSTGNFHEGTARIYCDHGLFTCQKELNEELEYVFNYLEDQKPIPRLKHLLVAQHNMQSSFLEMIDREIAVAKDSGKARIVIKLNNIEDRIMMEKLYQASEAGVEIIMLIRGICCLVPQMEFSKNIRVIRLVDGFLEHARMFLFHNQGAERLYMASADWMNRNLYRRIEVGFPVYNEDVKKQLLQILQLQLDDNVKAFHLDHNHDHVKIEQGDVPVRAQWAIYDWLKLHHGVTEG